MFGQATPVSATLVQAIVSQAILMSVYRRSFSSRSLLYLLLRIKVQVQENVTPVVSEKPVNEAENDDNIQDDPIQAHVIPNSPREGVMEDASVSESTDFDDNDPDAARIHVDRCPQPASYVSKRVKMVARKKRKKTTGPPPESSSKGKRLIDVDDDYNPDEDLDQEFLRQRSKGFPDLNL
ncbi:hypothetical protein L1987_15162 [Smallanthus sonchifolius]|uniref:Uncharacterized protein n=1 Tax=Smallanthus sonchifolius TaxID=185202 RepID=A0ACB9J741_9ASTR|nr:hypothetical protein L1987_15162 [Smallanthus sonchifolius]